MLVWRSPLVSALCSMVVTQRPETGSVTLLREGLLIFWQDILRPISIRLSHALTLCSHATPGPSPQLHPSTSSSSLH